ncbi:MAG: BON domain-containing protein [Anaerolineae bacterium]
MTATIQEKAELLTSRSEQNEPLIQAIHDTLQRYDPIRASDSPIHVATANGAVTLTGIVRSRTMKAMAGTLARRVAGVTEVENQLLTDTDIENAIALEMATNERLRQAGGTIWVKSILGTVYLSGDVTAESLEDGEDLKGLAEGIAEETSGVIRTINAIVVRERGQVMAAEAGNEGTAVLSAEDQVDLVE